VYGLTPSKLSLWSISLQAQTGLGLWSFATGFVAHDRPEAEALARGYISALCLGGNSGGVKIKRVTRVYGVDEARPKGVSYAGGDRGNSYVGSKVKVSGYSAAGAYANSPLSLWQLVIQAPSAVGPWAFGVHLVAGSKAEAEAIARQGVATFCGQGGHVVRFRRAYGVNPSSAKGISLIFGDQGEHVRH